MADRENFKFRLSDDLKGRWAKVCERKNVTQSGAVKALLEFFLAQEPLTQSMLLGQLDAEEDLIELALRRLERRRRKHE